MLNVLTDLGANNLVNNGSTDNSAKLTAALAALTAPYTLYFPTGTYLFTAQILGPAAKTTWVGDGKEQTTILSTRTSHTTDAAVNITSQSDITIRDMHITTLDTANATNYGLHLQSCTQIYLTRVKFSNFYTGCLHGGDLAEVDAVQCEFMRSYQEISASLVVGMFRNSTFTGCWFHDNNGTISTNHCIYIHTGVSVVPVGNTITGCVFENYTGGFAVVLNKGEPYIGGPCDIVGCTFNSTDVHAIGSIEATTTHGLTIVGNSATQGMALFGCTNFVVADNTIVLAAPGSVGLGIQGTGDVEGLGGRVANNVIAAPRDTYSFGIGIRLYGAFNVSVDGNVICNLFTGVAVIPNGSVVTTDCSITNNQFMIQTGATLTGVGYWFGNPNTTYGVTVDGGASKLTLLDNECVNLNYEVYFAQFEYTGIPDKVRFRSQSWDPPATAFFGFKSSTGPTNFTQFTQGSVGLSPTVAGTAFTAGGK